MKITKRQLKRIIKEEKQKLLFEAGAAYGNIPMAGFNTEQGFRDMHEDAMDLFHDMLDGSVFLMASADYDSLLEFITDMADDGYEDYVDFKSMLSANRQGQYRQPGDSQYVRISLR